MQDVYIKLNKSMIAMEKATFNKKKTFFTTKLDLHLRKTTSEMPHLEHSFIDGWNRDILEHSFIDGWNRDILEHSFIDGWNRDILENRLEIP
jgi:hypothetical protein